MLCLTCDPLLGGRLTAVLPYERVGVAPEEGTVYPPALPNRRRDSRAAEASGQANFAGRGRPAQRRT